MCVREREREGGEREGAEREREGEREKERMVVAILLNTKPYVYGACANVVGLLSVAALFHLA